MPEKDAKHSKSEDSALFRESLSDVKPLKTKARAAKTSAPPPRAMQRRADEEAVLDESLTLDPFEAGLEAGDEATYARPEVPRTTVRRLRQGKIHPQDEIDLHGLNRNDARRLLAEFLNECLDARIHCVRIIHGKGLGSGTDGPVLRPAVRRWLTRRDDVLAYTTASPRDGGNGATCVLLRTGR